MCPPRFVVSSAGRFFHCLHAIWQPRQPVQRVRSTKKAFARMDSFIGWRGGSGELEGGRGKPSEEGLPLPPPNLPLSPPKTFINGAGGVWGGPAGFPWWKFPGAAVLLLRGGRAVAKDNGFSARQNFRHEHFFGCPEGDLLGNLCLSAVQSTELPSRRLPTSQSFCGRGASRSGRSGGGGFLQKVPPPGFLILPQDYSGKS